MTTCVAAICEGGRTIVGVADRKLTVGDMEYEPPVTKIMRFTNSIAMLYSGAASTAEETAQLVGAPIRERVRTKPDEWWDVRQVAQLVADTYTRIIRQRVQRSIAAPKPLTASELHAMKDLVDYETQQRELCAIVAGVDPSGAHLYRIDCGQLECFDLQGFVAVGIGAGHASAELMRASYTIHRSFGQAVVLAYAAKRRSEVAPGVGTNTDVFTIGRGLGTYAFMNFLADDLLLRIYRDITTAEQRAYADAMALADGFSNEDTGEDRPQIVPRLPGDDRITPQPPAKAQAADSARSSPSNDTTSASDQT